jgi:hypothetical protein
MFEHTAWFIPHVVGYYESEAKKAMERYTKLKALKEEVTKP